MSLIEHRTANTELSTIANKDIDTIWDILLGSRDHSAIKSIRWKALRKGLCLADVDLQLTTLGILPQAIGRLPRSCWRIAEQQASDDAKSIKLRLDSSDGLACESVVLFPRPARATACISTQVGCAVGCIFCATGRMGWRRNLTVAEMVEQLYYARRLALEHGRHLRNVVFMGMGEPLHNFDALVESLDWIVASDGFGISPRHITVSTIGVPGKMIDLAKRFPLVRIALSLHSGLPAVRKNLVLRANCNLDTLRNTIIELNRISPTHPVWLEYVLLRQRNDSTEDARALIEFCRGLRVEINIIPYNVISFATASEFSGDIVSASLVEDQENFLRILRAAGIFTTLRKSLGQSIAAACGQLCDRRN